MRINHNISSMNTYRLMNANNTNSAKSMEKLSSGLRIGKAADDAAGLSISEKMRSQIRGLDQAQRNAQDGISLLQTAEGGMNETHDILQRMRELANQSSNGVNKDEDRKALNDEFKQLKEEIDGIANRTEFNGKKLIDGSLKSDGATVGTNTTSGAQVLTQTSAKAVSATATFNAADYTAVNLATQPTDTLSIDSVSVKIDWEKKLSDSEKLLLDRDYTTPMTQTEQNEIKATMQRVINESIDEHNAANGTNVQHVKVFEDSTGALNIQSGSAGQDSKLSITSAAGGVLNTYMGAATVTNGQNLMASNIAGTETLQFEVNGVTLKTAALGAATAGTTDADTVATDIQTKMRTAIDTYNTNAGLKVGDEGFIDKDKVYVEAKDGRFSIKSESGAINLKEQEGFTLVKDLGLTQAQTEGAGAGGMTFQIGANKGQELKLSIGDMRSAALGVASADIGTAAGSKQALDTVAKAIQSVSSERSKLGAAQNRLEHSINNMSTSSQNLSAAESRIRDVDMAKEMMEFQKNNILSQAAQAMMSQANQQPQGVLQLLR
ncbi:flagellin [Ammoniphilus sp. YIM 78166]|uniref:flagellin N-terminal helical domain-containing protein n=1 Tax=Ammoniphilus sp. YIM 78166 TaxID=1644106 RepID=UPI00106F64FA|nr:flagellin [Ammoniphilus sp. YIM 78166]